MAGDLVGWLVFLLEDVAIASGVECGLHLGPASIVLIALASFCAAWRALHPRQTTQALPVRSGAHFRVGPRPPVRKFATELPWRPQPNFTGHNFILTLAMLFLSDWLHQTRTIAWVNG